VLLGSLGGRARGQRREDDRGRGRARDTDRDDRRRDGLAPPASLRALTAAGFFEPRRLRRLLDGAD
jgi:hypothetical protein